MNTQDHSIISLLKTDRNAAFRELYHQAFTPVAHFVCRMGGSYADAKDIFHDTLIILYEKVVEEEFPFKSSVTAYVLGISKHLWMRQYRQDQRELPLSEAEKAISMPEDYPLEKTPRHTIREVLELAGQKCMKILQAFYYSKNSMQEIARQFGYATTRSATVQKFKCLEKVRTKVKENALDYEALAS